MTTSQTITQTKLEWYCKTMPKEDYDKSRWAVEVYLRDPKRVCLGECLFCCFVPHIPRELKPNTMSYATLFFSIILLISSLGIPLTANDDAITKAYLCLICCFANTMTLSLDALDGMHARATKQCSDLGALLDWWIDSIGTSMNACAIAFAVNFNNNNQLFISIGVGCAVLMFNEQLLLKYYKHRLERIIGVEGQISCSILFCILAVIYTNNIHITYSIYVNLILGIIPPIGCAYSCFEFLWRFRVEWNDNMWNQWYISALSILLINILFTMDYITSFEYSLIFITLSQYINGGIVGYLVTELKLPKFEKYFIYGSIAILIENLSNPLHQTLVSGFKSINFLNLNDDTLNNMHFTAYLLFGFTVYSNMKDFIMFYRKAVEKDIKKKIK